MTARFLAMLLTLPTGLLLAQEPAAPGSVNLLGARVSLPTPRVGEPFNLSITAHLPGGHIVYFPEQLPVREGIESVGPATWTLESIPGDSAALTLQYPLRSFVWGERQVPAAEILIRRQSPADEGGVSTETRVGPWAAVTGLAHGSFSRRPIVPGSVQVQTVLPMSRPEEGLPVRARQDVLGRDRSPVVLGLLGIAGAIVLAWILMALRRVLLRLWGRWKSRVATASRRPISSRSQALAELDEILGLGLHTSGRFDEFYTRASSTTRRYVESLDESLGPALTYRELVRRLGAGGAEPEVKPLREVLGSAEFVRFGARRPDAPRAEADLLTLRDWLQRYPPRNGTS